MKFLSQDEIVGIIKDARDLSLLLPEDTVAHFIDFEIIKDRMDAVKTCFPDNALHTAAIKANPLTGVLKSITKSGFHLEAASFDETIHGLNCGSLKVCWDSPVKTSQEFNEIQSHKNVIINCDSLEEAELAKPYVNGHDVLLRINPQIKGTAHASMSVAGHYSKFGEPISNKKNIVDFVSGNEFISGLHVHTSSQTLNYSELVTSIKEIVSLAIEINLNRTSPLKYINIGGGYPVSYLGNSDFPIEHYVKELRAHCPSLFDKFILITEFGRYYQANSGFTLMKIARVKKFDKLQIIIGHAGADMFLRECYQPGVWPHRLILIDDAFAISEAGNISTDLAGPLCFGGDYIQRAFDFPTAKAGDYVIIQDSGANSISLWSKHCSRSFPKCILRIDHQLEVIRERDTLERNLSFWS